MGRPIGPKKVHRYSVEFKLTAVKLSGMRVLKGRTKRRVVESSPARELKRLQVLEREHAMLQEEHELLKKAIRFCSERRRKSSRSSIVSGQASA